MVSRQRKTPSEKHSKFESALKNADFIGQIAALEPSELFAFAHNLKDVLYWWLGDPTNERLNKIQTAVPLLDKFVDFELVFKRLKSLSAFKHTEFGIHISKFFPELSLLHAASVARIESLPSGIAKAEYWLTAIAQKATADADIEAAIYLASRGHRDALDIVAIRNSWHSAICQDIKFGVPADKVPITVLERAHAQTISLAEAAEVLRFNQSLPRFFGFLNEEEDFIDATMVRAVEWLGITGFSPWLESLISQLSLGPQDGIDNPAYSGWWLFHWCRSDLALRMADRHGLEAWLWALVNGQMERNRPWRLFYADHENSRMRDYLALSGIILFVWGRITPLGMKEDVLQRATDLLLQTQMRCGAWPLYTDDSEPSLLTTCAAIHGIALQKPKGWDQVVSRAAEWLSQQQQPGGYWHIDGGPTVMLTVLTLDALVLARGGTEVTFKLDTETTRTISVEAGEKGANKANLTTILFLASDPTDASRLRLGEELREIQEKLRLAQFRDKFDLHQRMSVRPADISQALLDICPRIVHISGHGAADGDLCFEDQVGNILPVAPDALAALFEQFSDQVHCVVLNACYSEKQARAISTHIPYVIGMDRAIGDHAAIAFSVGFYQALGAGRTIEDAYKLGCVQIRLQNIPEHLTPLLIKKATPS
jgi:hypothetical protein